MNLYPTHHHVTPRTGWLRISVDVSGNHSKLFLNASDGTWSTKCAVEEQRMMRIPVIPFRYNFFYDRLLALDLFPADFVTRDIEFVIEQVIGCCILRFVDVWPTCVRRATALLMGHRWTHKARSEAFALGMCNVFNAGTVTKLDWLAWTAAVGNIAQRQKLLQWVFDLAESRGAVGGRVPMSDFYDVTTVRLFAACEE
jgi:hypothetical protein